ncbi:MAG: DUF6134 family protein [Pseudomonadota bacterium]|nr:DUF6134 family protein [Pseudomonadota bacterium]
MKRGAALSVVLAAFFTAACRADPAPTGTWQFRALLDGTPIGQHRFDVIGQGEERQVVSVADFAVKFMGFTAYRYHHRATEQWHGSCLTRLHASTDDNGKHSEVHQEPGATDPCVMSFAYWNPAIRTQPRLLNAQTGQMEAVEVRKVGTGSVTVGGKAVEATEYRIEGPEHPISVWYAPDGLWVGLDSTVAGGRKLSYRLP